MLKQKGQIWANVLARVYAAKMNSTDLRKIESSVWQSLNQKAQADTCSLIRLIVFAQDYAYAHGRLDFHLLEEWWLNGNL